MANADAVVLDGNQSIIPKTSRENDEKSVCEIFAYGEERRYTSTQDEQFHNSKLSSEKLSFISPRANFTLCKIFKLDN